MDFLTPDFSRTLRRFPLAILLSALAALIFVAFNNDLLTTDNEAWERATIGLMTAGAFAVAGRLFAESRDDHPWLAIFLSFVLPVVVALLFQVRDSFYAAPFLLFPVSGLWMSVAAFTSWGERDQRDDIQNRFWWLNHRAVITGVIALAGFLLIAGGMLVIDRSLALLFNIDTSALLIDTVLPVFGLFFAPVYWLSTIPALDDFEQTDLTEPDFLSRAIGFLGQFVLTPLLLIYAAILFAYTVQILIQQQLPEGTLGWMVLFFVVAGAANWLVLHPPFMRAHKLVQLFRSYWFWLTLLPVGLYALAVWTRIGAYGLTDERMLLIAGGLWAALVTLAFLSQRFADIRLIPGIAALVLLILSVGPCNMQQAAIWDQSRRLEAALQEGNWDASSARFVFEDDAISQTALSAARYLQQNGAEELVDAAFARHSKEAAPEEWSDVEVALQTEAEREELAQYGSDALPWPDSLAPEGFVLGTPNERQIIELSETPFLLGRFDLIAAEQPMKFREWEFQLNEGALIVFRDGNEIGRAQLKPWVDLQIRDAQGLTEQRIAISTSEGPMLMLAAYAVISPERDNPLVFLNGQLFASDYP